MDEGWVIFGLLLVAVPFVLPIVSLVRSSRTSARVREVEKALTEQQRTIDTLTRQLADLRKPVPTAAPAAATTPAPAAAPPALAQPIAAPPINPPLMSGAASLELLCRHIPDRYEHLVRYVGWYSNRARGERAKQPRPPAGVALPSPGEEPATEFSSRARAALARLIRKVYEADPLECPNCNGRMRVIALIEKKRLRAAGVRERACRALAVGIDCSVIGR